MRPLLAPALTCTETMNDRPIHQPVYATEIALTNDVKTDVTSVGHDVSCAVWCRHHHRQCAVNDDDNDVRCTLQQ